MTPLERIDDMQAALRPKPGSFDPSRFGDPLAAKTAWGPLCHGGSNFRTHAGVEVSPERFEFQPTAGAKMFAGVFAVFGLVPAFLVWKFMGNLDTPLKYVVALPALLFLGVAWLLWTWLARPVVFDRREDWFYKGKRSPAEDPSLGSGKDACPLSRIRAIQIVPERVSSRNGGFGSWEINAVLEDGSRRNVVDHGSEAAVRTDAAALASFLSVPLWNLPDGFRPTS